MRPCDGSALTVGELPTLTQLSEFATYAALDGRELVVGAVICDPEGRLYVQRRSRNRALFPGCWDLVGGHAEPGETVVEALARELLEETGWRLEQIGPVVELVDWEAAGVARREVDLLVRVNGNLSQPRLEIDKHTEGRWLLASEAHLLLQGREYGDRWVYEVVKRAFVLIGPWRAGNKGVTEVE